MPSIDAAFLASCRLYTIMVFVGHYASDEMRAPPARVLRSCGQRCAGAVGRGHTRASSEETPPDALRDLLLRLRSHRLLLDQGEGRAGDAAARPGDEQA